MHAACLVMQRHTLLTYSVPLTCPNCLHSSCGWIPQGYLDVPLSLRLWYVKADNSLSRFCGLCIPNQLPCLSLSCTPLCRGAQLVLCPLCIMPATHHCCTFALVSKCHGSATLLHCAAVVRVLPRHGREGHGAPGVHTRPTANYSRCG